MKIFVSCLLIAFAACSFAEDGDTKKRSQRGDRRFAVQFGGFLKNLGCRIRHFRTKLDREGRPQGCTRYCSGQQQPGYDIRFGHTCKDLEIPEGCADRFCFRCARGYLTVQFRYGSADKCVKECPDGYVQRKRTCVEIPRGCKNPACTECKDGLYSVRWRYMMKSECVDNCPYGFGLNAKRNRCVRCRKFACKECHNDALSCDLCTYGYLLLKDGNRTRCVRECPKGFEEDYDDMTQLVCIRKNEKEKEESDKKKACLVIGCKVCSSNVLQCEKCQAGFVSYRSSANDTLQCLADCPDNTEKVILDGQLTCIVKPKENCSVDHCEECLDSGIGKLHLGCVRCEENFYLKRDIFSDRCVQRCPSGFYEGVKPGTDIKACLDCQVPFCTQCVSAKKCFRCLAPLVISPKTGQCSVCPWGTTFDVLRETCVKAVEPIKEKTEEPKTTEKPTAANDLSSLFVINKL